MARTGDDGRDREELLEALRVLLRIAYSHTRGGGNRTPLQTADARLLHAFVDMVLTHESDGELRRVGRYRMTEQDRPLLRAFWAIAHLLNGLPPRRRDVDVERIKAIAAAEGLSLDVERIRRAKQEGEFAGRDLIAQKRGPRATAAWLVSLMKGSLDHHRSPDWIEKMGRALQPFAPVLEHREPSLGAVIQRGVLADDTTLLGFVADEVLRVDLSVDAGEIVKEAIAASRRDGERNDSVNESLDVTED